MIQRKHRLNFFFLILFAFAFKSADAQYFDFGGFGGISSYMGDINQGTPLTNPQLGAGLLLRYNFTTRFSVRGNFMFGSIQGDDLVAQKVEGRDLNFTNKILEVSGQLEINFLSFFPGYNYDQFSPYIFFGIGVFNHNPQAEFDGVTYDLRELNTEGQGSLVYPDREPYSTTQFCVPFGVGVKYSLGERLIGGVEWGIRKTFTDYLDDISETYYFNSNLADPNDPAFALSDPTLSHNVGEQRGDPQFNDWYSFLGVTLTYKFRFKKTGICPSFDQSKPFN